MARDGRKKFRHESSPWSSIVLRTSDEDVGLAGFNRQRSRPTPSVHKIERG